LWLNEKSGQCGAHRDIEECLPESDTDQTSTDFMELNRKGKNRYNLELAASLMIISIVAIF